MAHGHPLVMGQSDIYPGRAEKQAPELVQTSATLQSPDNGGSSCPSRSPHLPLLCPPHPELPGRRVVLHSDTGRIFWL